MNEMPLTTFFLACMWGYCIGGIFLLFAFWVSNTLIPNIKWKIAEKRRLKWEENAKRLPVSYYQWKNGDEAYKSMRRLSRSKIEELYKDRANYNHEDRFLICCELADRKNNNEEGRNRWPGTDVFYFERNGNVSSEPCGYLGIKIETQPKR